MTTDQARDMRSAMQVTADNRRQAVIGLVLAAAILGSWAILHVYGHFFFVWSWQTAPVGVALMVVLTWLYVGMFIIAHDCMHGSLVPLRPAWNRVVGQICLGLYAGFWFDFMNRKHHMHHRHAGTAEDPDFLDTKPHAFWSWYLKFFREYFSGREIIVIAVWVWLYMLWFEVPIANLMTFFTIPAIASSVQLFYFGTYLPHRPDDPARFADRHRSRSNDYPWLVSLLTCFHFGYHHEHHDVPDAPWWRLPAVRSAAGPNPGIDG